MVTKELFNYISYACLIKKVQLTQNFQILFAYITFTATKGIVFILWCDFA